MHIMMCYVRTWKILGDKRKPSTVTDYNQTKYGVDIVDQMARIYTCKLSSRRWPVQVIP